MIESQILAKPAICDSVKLRGNSGFLGSNEKESAPAKAMGTRRVSKEPNVAFHSMKERSPTG